MLVDQLDTASTVAIIILIVAVMAMFNLLLKSRSGGDLLRVAVISGVILVVFLIGYSSSVTPVTDAPAVKAAPSSVTNYSKLINALGGVHE